MKPSAPVVAAAIAVAGLCIAGYVVLASPEGTGVTGQAAGRAPARSPVLDSGGATASSGPSLPVAAEDRTRLAADALARARTLQTAVNEYYANNMRWPSSAAETGLPEPATPRGGAVRAIELRSDGTIVIAFDQRFAPGSSIVLTPEADRESGAIAWHCSARGDAVLAACKP